ncbi:related to Cystathionine gamma-synthase [Saccharomycodes ludwigii]|uniref:Related to Cystathionine gamma-synthase n=1 Tax=Saccharomycodes ludwigii TaxID=36035 RepID=A0A376B4X5_9ASCO|nr:related to Cystathionine gamma-synthase [Saccharomycodes ludwigii]
MFKVATRVGESVPPDTQHAVSVSLPTWESNIGYRELNPVVMEKFVCGYPRVFVPLVNQDFCNKVLDKYSKPSSSENGEAIEEKCLIFPSLQVAKICVDFVIKLSNNLAKVRIVKVSGIGKKSTPQVYAVIVDAENYPHLKEYYQIAGEGISSRLGNYLLNGDDGCDPDELSLAGSNAKSVVKRRISDEITDTMNKCGTDCSNAKLDANKDISLYSSGMASIFSALKLILSFDNEGSTSFIGKKKTVMFGVGFSDTITLLERFSNNYFLPYDKSSTALTYLENEILIKSKQENDPVLAVFLETPSNPLVKMADLIKLHELSIKYGFYLVVDNTVSGFVNLNVLPYADIVVSSLTKLFSGASNLLAGSLILNPGVGDNTTTQKKALYDFAVNEYFPKYYEDLLWEEDAIVLAKNSEDYVDRVHQTNANAEWCVNEVLMPYKGKLFKGVNYITTKDDDDNETLKNYTAIKNPVDGGYGTLCSVTFYDLEKAKAFYDNLKVCKGPSLGTNFTLSCPYTLLAHYFDLEEAAEHGLDKTLIRISIGMENREELKTVFNKAIKAALQA